MSGLGERLRRLFAAARPYVEPARNQLLRFRQCLSPAAARSEEHTSELQSRLHLVCRLLLEKKKKSTITPRSMLVTQPLDAEGDLKFANSYSEHHRTARRVFMYDLLHVLLPAAAHCGTRNDI